jgi:hypothetical protein
MKKLELVAAIATILTTLIQFVAMAWIIIHIINKNN